MYEWEEYTIKITHPNEKQINAEKAGEVTDRFESELFRLIQKYQGQADLKIEAKNSDHQPLVEYY